MGKGLVGCMRRARRQERPSSRRLRDDRLPFPLVHGYMWFEESTKGPSEYISKGS